MQLKTAVAIGLVAVGGWATVPASASGPKLAVRAARLDKVGPTTWTGKALSPQLGAGRVTLIGKITFTDTDADNPNGDTHVIRFRATFKKGWMRGCFVNTTLLRPGNRQVWDGAGRVIATSAACAAIAASSSARAGGHPPTTPPTPTRSGSARRTGRASRAAESQERVAGRALRR